MSPTITLAAIAALYLSAFAAALKVLSHANEKHDLSSFRRQKFSGDLLLLVFAVIAHGVVLLGTSVFSRQPQFGFAHAISAMLLVAAFVYLLESRIAPIGLIRLIVAPAAAIAVALPIGFPGAPLNSTRIGLGFEIHFALAILAYGLTAIAALHAIAMMLIDFVLHKPRLFDSSVASSSPWQRVLLDLSPPLLVMEQLLFKTLAFGFIALTLTLVTGIGFHEQVFGRPLSFDHKTVFSILSWLTFAVLVFGRWRYGWRGRVALRYVLIGFVLLLLSYMGTHFVLEVVLGRHG